MSHEINHGRFIIQQALAIRLCSYGVTAYQKRNWWHLGLNSQAEEEISGPHLFQYLSAVDTVYYSVCVSVGQRMLAVRRQNGVHGPVTML